MYFLELFRSFFGAYGVVALLLFCLTDMTIVHEFEIGRNQAICLNAKDKEYELRVAGESAEYEIEVNREFVEE